MRKTVLFTPSGLHIREAGNGKTESRTIEGCAIVFGKETVLYEDATYKESEIIAPGCVTEEFLRTQDIKLNLLHDRMSSLARYREGEGSLKLDLRSDGLYFSFEAPECDLGDRALALVRNGTYTGCSFEFFSQDYEIEERAIGDYLVTHKAFKKITALTIAMDPAYEDTSVSAREELLQRRQTDKAGKDTAHPGEAEQRERKAKYYKSML